MKITNKTVDKKYGLVYARVSSKRQETEGSGLGSQEGRCKNKLTSLAVTYDRTFPDTFSGGGDFMNRPAMREMLAYIDANPHKKFVVVFDDLKRFARDVEFHFKLRTAFQKRSVDLHCLNYNFDESPEGRFSETIMAAQAELERHQNRRQVIQKQKARLELGYYPFSRKEGYDIIKDASHGKIAKPNRVGLELLKPAMEGFAKGVLPRVIDVCKYLFESGCWKTQAPEKYIDRVTKWLKDPFYAGIIRYDKWEVSGVKGKHEPIISLETHEAILRRLNKKDLFKRVRLDTSPDFPLRGLLTCSECGKHLTGAWSRGRNKKYPHYWCCNWECSNKGKTISKKIIEGQFEELLQRNRLKDDVDILLSTVFDRVWKDEMDKIKEHSKTLENNKKALEEKINDFANLMRDARTEVTKRAFENQLEKAAQELEKMNEENKDRLDYDIPYRTAFDMASGMLKRPYEIWANLDVVEKQKLFFFIFEEKLPYNRIVGFRTAEKPYAVRLFEEFVSEDTRCVDHVGLEPTTSYMPCKRSSQLS